MVNFVSVEYWKWDFEDDGDWEMYFRKQVKN